MKEKYIKPDSDIQISRAAKCFLLIRKYIGKQIIGFIVLIYLTSLAVIYQIHQ